MEKIKWKKIAFLKKGLAWFISGTLFTHENVHIIILIIFCSLVLISFFFGRLHVV
jgi:hypothetical protein